MKKTSSLFCLVLCTFILILSCSSKNDNQISLDEKIGQMLMFGFRGTVATDEWIQTFSQQILDYHIGGVLVLSYNIQSPTQLDSLITHFHNVKKYQETLYAIDQEGGRVQRLHPNKGFTGFPSAQYTAENLSLSEAYSNYLSLARECKDYGFNLILAPVVDVNVNPESPAIGNLERSFSSDPQVVTEYASVFIQAIKDIGLLSSLKHFPGHGSATADSHLGMTDITETWSETELIPYNLLLERNLVQSIMSAHVFNTNFDSEYPASLSENYITNLLRNDMQYDGVIITDDLQMGAILNYHTLEEIIIQSINSGSDILIFSQYFEPNIELPAIVHGLIRKAVNDKIISKNRINQSYQRIMNFKSQIN